TAALRSGLGRERSSWSLQGFMHAGCAILVWGGAVENDFKGVHQAARLVNFVIALSNFRG
ncbi:MAG: hypothetical protein ACLGI6_03280, partial [Gammaproteobacteria bacterium]